MQRWMAAKLHRAKRVGMVKSGAGRPMGDVSEDRVIRRGTDEPFHRISKRDPNDITTTVRKASDARPVAWGSRKAAKRAHTPTTPWPMAADSLTTTR